MHQRRRRRILSTAGLASSLAARLAARLAAAGLDRLALRRRRLRGVLVGAVSRRRVSLGDLFRVACLFDLRRARQRERSGGHVARHRRPRADHRPLPDAHGRDQLTVRTDERPVLDHRLELLVAVVVARDGAGADVHLLADRRVAEVAEVVGLAALPDDRLLGLDEVAEVHLGTQLRPRTHVRERSDDRARTDHRVGRDAVGPQLGARADLGVGQDAAVADAHAVPDARPPAQRDVAPQLGVDADLDVGLDHRGGGIAEGDVRLPGAVDARAQRGLGLRQLLAIVDAGDVAEVGLDRRDADALRGARDDVGQVVLALRVGGAETQHGLAEEVRRPAVDTRVDLRDGLLVRRRVLLLDHADHVAALVAQDP